MSNISNAAKSANRNRKLALLWCAVHIDISAFSFYTHRLIGYFYEFSKSYRIDLTILSHTMRHILWALDLKYFHSFSNVRLLVDATAFFLPNEIKRLIYFCFDAISAHLTVSASLSIRLNSTQLNSLFECVAVYKCDFYLAKLQYWTSVKSFPKNSHFASSHSF